MNLINKRLLAQKIELFDFPSHEKLASAKKLLENWKKALKDSDLEKTKEKSVQGKFLATFFESILEYTDVTSGQGEWTLIQHPRIENDSKEPDGSLGWFTKDNKNTRAVIELKDAKTQLDKKQYRGSEKLTPIEQAYLYATKYEGCNWIIVSNFKEIRLYNKYKTQDYYEKFNVIDLIEEAEFKRFYFLFCKKNLLSKYQESVIDVLAKDTTEAEQDITKKFYSEYRQIRLNLLGHLINNNSEIQKEVLLEKTQKLLDKFIFTLFCEDTSSLLPLNIVKDTYNRALRSFSSSEQRVWNEFKGLFQAIDKGNSRVKPPINAYNGGLFITDTVLDNLVIKDEFWDELIRLADYDFETDLNVNILGHIFEQSISDLESLKSELLGKEQDKKKNKRKKDGIYYTPEYITRYIVENTAGKYLEENPDKLSTIKILDPACGSGAFLNQAHSFLINEYKARHEALINKKLEKGEAITLFDYNHAGTNREILLNNLFGVDLNQESVEITKLALWLKTARGTEPLQNLDKNIKTGNSLIDDPEIAGNKAFNWNIEFKDIMDEGGFDVIIGNPPYVKELDNADVFKPIQSSSYKKWYQGKMDLWYLFLHKSIDVIKEDGYIGFITSSYWLKSEGASKLIERIKEELTLIKVVEFGDIKVFENVSGKHMIHLYQKRKTSESDKTSFIKINPDTFIGFIDENESVELPTINLIANNKISLTSDINIFQDKTYAQLGEIYEVSQGVVEATDKVSKNQAIKSTGNSVSIGTGVFVLAKDELKDLTLNNEEMGVMKKYLDSNDVSRYGVAFNDEYLIYSDKSIVQLISQNKLPNIKKHLDRLKEFITSSNKPYGLHRARESRYFTNPKIIAKGMFARPEFYYDEDKYYVGFSFSVIIQKTPQYSLKYLLALMNSNIGAYWFLLNGKRRGIGVDIGVAVFRHFPISEADNNLQHVLAEFVDEIQKGTKEQIFLILSIKDFIKNEFNLSLDNNYLKSLTTLGWNEFTEMLDRKKVKLDLDKKEELFTWFRTKQSELQKIQNKINSIDNQINQEVYKLYGLTDDEIKTVESSITI